MCEIEVFSPSHPFAPSTRREKAERREKGECKLQDKHDNETHKQRMLSDTACKDRSTSKLKFYQSTHKQSNNENLGNHRDHLESTKFSPKQVRVKKSSLGQKLCKFYLYTYHYTTGSRRNRGSRVEKRGKTQSILGIKSGNTVSNLGT